jgi:hypothetical protein
MEYAVYIAIAAVVIVVAAVIFMPKPVTHTKLDLSSPKVNIPEKLSDKLLRINEELGPAILESLRAQEAENGRAFTLPVGQVFLADTLRIMYSFMKANDGATYAMGTFLSEIAPTLHPHVASQLELCPDGRAQGARQLLSKLAETNDGEVKLPQTLCSLSDFDNEHRTQHVIRMARFYCDFVAYLSKSGKTEFADANRVVESRYMELIAAYTEKVQVGQLTTDTPTLPPSTEEDDEWERLGRRFAAFAGADGHSVWLRFLPAGLQFEDADSCIMTDIACVLKTFCIGKPMLLAVHMWQLIRQLPSLKEVSEDGRGILQCQELIEKSGETVRGDLFWGPVSIGTMHACDEAIGTCKKYKYSQIWLDMVTLAYAAESSATESATSKQYLDKVLEGYTSFLRPLVPNVRKINDDLRVQNELLGERLRKIYADLQEVKLGQAVKPSAENLTTHIAKTNTTYLTYKKMLDEARNFLPDNEMNANVARLEQHTNDIAALIVELNGLMEQSRAAGA